MRKDHQQEREQDASADPKTSRDDGWSEEARRWYEELKGEESALAPWLAVEWTGSSMRVRRG